MLEILRFWDLKKKIYIKALNMFEILRFWDLKKKIYIKAFNMLEILRFWDLKKKKYIKALNMFEILRFWDLKKKNIYLSSKSVGDFEILRFGNSLPFPSPDIAYKGAVFQVCKIYAFDQSNVLVLMD